VYVQPSGLDMHPKPKERAHTRDPFQVSANPALEVVREPLGVVIGSGNLLWTEIERKGVSVSPIE